jgi:putative restriction endonuclease
MKASPGDWLHRVGEIRPWTRGAERAPHKPLVLLYAIGHLQRTGSPEIPFSEAMQPLERLLQQFGPPRDRHHPEYPFFHLGRDKGLWELHGLTPFGSSGSPSRQQLIQSKAVGRLNADFAKALLDSPALMAQVVRQLLDSNFPESLHPDITEQIGLDITALELIKARSQKRDPEFREHVLLAYERRCAICGYEGRLGVQTVAVDAAHVRWWAFAGPDGVANGICLCAMHHKLFDLGVVGISDSHRLLVSAHFIAHDSASNNMILKYLGAPVAAPQAGFPAIADEHAAWHRSEVFKAPHRPLP